MVRQTREWLQTSDVFNAVFDELNHLACEEPSLAALVAQGDDLLCGSGRILDMCRLLEPLRLTERHSGRLSYLLKDSNRCVVPLHLHVGARKVMIIERLVIHSVEDEVEKIQYNCFATFFLDNANDIVVRGRMVFYKNLTYDTDLRLLYIAQRQIVEIHAYALAVALELFPVAVPAVLHRYLVPLLIESVGTALFNLIWTC